MHKSIALWSLAIAILAYLFGIPEAVADETSMTGENEKLQLVKIFFEKVDSQADIDSKFTYLTNDFVYIHEGYGGEYSRQDLYNGFLRNWKNGNYKDSEPVKILSTFSGLNMLVIKREPGGTTLFEFEKDKISRIKEYW
ncbi:hypothetical protein [Aliikangiella sp. G2MR2-5]|uniref:hypothetical protein n=1 Tax=Aliikangiella sp. G2MR2-5 TaxID=2788943 RepID=UPI0018A915A8|nr:hypothetical protein [Aliikangiella sp. G2MR2-5]